MKRKTVLLAVLAAAALGILAPGSRSRAEGEIRVLPTDLSGGAPYEATVKTNPEVYEDPTIRVERHTVYHKENPYNIAYFYADVTIRHASQLRTASADPKGFLTGWQETGQRIARRVNAVLALDGDFCDNYRKNERRKYCLRQGVVYRDTVAENLDMLLIDEDGNFHVYRSGADLAEKNKEEIDGKKIVNAFQFGPALVIDGEPAEDEYILDPAHSPVTAEPEKKAARMCIAQVDELHYFVLTNWFGINLAQLRDLVLSITPCKTLYVMDGGNSAQLIYLKSHVNQSETNGRKITDIIYFASADFVEESK
ncbi:MAG: phosphodiester glycosidase family protein [Clostridia bacterium]|nr:phosphodiester glycosidase family protein [Clostridia bacterium]